MNLPILKTKSSTARSGERPMESRYLAAFLIALGPWMYLDGDWKMRSVRCLGLGMLAWDVEGLEELAFRPRYRGVYKQHVRGESAI